MSMIVIMREVDLHSIDLNLLKLFHALVRERSVTRAGLRLGLSQPAASRALNRLRSMLNDPLVVRGKSGLELTPRADQLADAVTRLLEDARSIISPAAFDPAVATGRMTIAALDHLSLLIVPGLITRSARQAPSLEIAIAQPSGDNVGLVEQGAVDVAVGLFDSLPASLHQRTLYTDDYVCIVRRGHPAASERFTTEHYLALRHIVITISGIGQSAVDAALSDQALARHVALRVPHFLLAGMVVAESDMIFTLPRRLAVHLAGSLPLEVLDVPLRLPPMAPAMIWHERLHRDAAQMWLRQQIVDATLAYRPTHP
jgi:DNA-binding transcriptional LysR family regulator